MNKYSLLPLTGDGFGLLGSGFLAGAAEQSLLKAGADPFLISPGQNAL